MEFSFSPHHLNKLPHKHFPLLLAPPPLPSALCGQCAVGPLSFCPCYPTPPSALWSFPPVRTQSLLSSTHSTCLPLRVAKRVGFVVADHPVCFFAPASPSGFFFPRCIQVGSHVERSGRQCIFQICYRRSPPCGHFFFFWCARDPRFKLLFSPPLLLPPPLPHWLVGFLFVTDLGFLLFVLLHSFFFAAKGKHTTQNMKKSNSAGFSDFHDNLSNEWYLKAFKEFCLKEFNIENLLFWLDVEIYRSSSPNKVHEKERTENLCQCLAFPLCCAVYLLIVCSNH